MPPIKKRDRRRLGARTYKNYSEDMLLLAVELVKTKKTTSYDAEKQFGIPRRTIEKRVKNLHTNKPGPHFRLSQEEEQKFIKVLIAAGDFGCPLSQLDFKLAVHDYLKKNNKTYLFNDKIPGTWWVRNFLERHHSQLTLRSTQNITRARAEKTLEEFKEYFKNLETSLQNVPPKNIMNYDETNVSDDPCSTKCIFRRGVKYPERIVNHSKGCISIMFAGTADGELLPPYVVYKSENLWTEWCKDGPEGARYNRTKSGWFDSAMFLDWFIQIVIPWARQLEGIKVVIGDNLSSHLNPDVVELCEIHKIRFIFLPPQSTQITQPLDVAFFGPLKKSWRTILLQYKIDNPRQTSLNKTHFPLLLKKLIEAANIKKENLLNGFKATGIHPFNPYEVYKKLPEYEDDIRYDVDLTLLEYLKENKHPNPIRRAKNKKINVPPGKSVSNVDIPNLLSNKNESLNPKNDTKKKTNTVTLITETEQNKNQISGLQVTQETKIYKRKPLKRKIFNNSSSSDSHSSRSVPCCDTSSDYDPRADEYSDLDDAINENTLDGTDSNKIIVSQSFVKGNDKEKMKSRRHEDCVPDMQYLNKRNEKTECVTDCGKVLKRQDVKDRYEELIGDNTKLVTVCRTDNEEIKNLITDDLHRKKKSQDREKKVTILSDIKNIPENKAYFDLKKYGPLVLETIDTSHTVKARTNPCKKIDSLKENEVHSIKSNSAGLISSLTTELIRTTSSPTDVIANNDEFAAGCSKEPEYNTCISYNVNDYILVRYVFKKKVDYYVGKIIMKQENKYEVSFFKRCGRNDNTKFIEPKKKDIDIIKQEMIVKEVQVVPFNERETELVLLEDDDLMYFDY